MPIDTRELEPDSIIRADLCIVGGGAAGITIARELAGGPLDVVLLESGGLEADAGAHSMNEGEVSGEPLLAHHTPVSLDQVRMRLLGGTTNHWAGFCRPLEPIDFETRDYLEVSGWPLTPEDLQPYWDRAVDVIQLASHSFDLETWQRDFGAPPAMVDTDSVATTLFQIHFPFPYSKYLPELESAPNIEVYLHANVTRLNAAGEADRIDSVTVETLTGNHVTVEADTFVVAAGGIENPRLLLASNDVRTDGIGNQNGLVGRYFTEHLQVLAGFAVLAAPAEDWQLYADVPVGDVSAKGALTLTRQTVVENQMLGMEAQVLVAEPIPGSPEYANGLRTDDVQALVQALEVPDGMSTAYVQVLAEQELNRDSRVTLSDGADPFGQPRARVDWRHTDLDRTSILAGLRIMGTELGRLGAGRLQITPGGFDPSAVPTAEGGLLSAYKVSVDDINLEDFPLGIGFHHMCTTRMDDDPERGVVDSDCRVHDVGNLYIAGSSVFSTGGVATPTFNITALALRLADHLSARN